MPSAASEVSHSSSYYPGPAPRRPAEAPASPFGDLLDAATPPPDNGPPPPSSQTGQTPAADSTSNTRAAASSSDSQGDATQGDEQGDSSQPADTAGVVAANVVHTVAAKVAHASPTSTVTICADGDPSQSPDPNAKSTDSAAAVIAATVAPSANIDPSLLPAVTVVAPTIPVTAGASEKTADQADVTLTAAAPGLVATSGAPCTNNAAAGELPPGALPAGDLPTDDTQAPNLGAGQSSTTGASSGKAPAATVPTGKASVDQTTDMPAVQGLQPSITGGSSATNPVGTPIGRRSSTVGTTGALDPRKDPTRPTIDDATSTDEAGDSAEPQSSQVTADPARPSPVVDAPRHAPETIVKPGTSWRPETDTQTGADKLDPLPLVTSHAHAVDQIAAAVAGTSQTTTVGQTPQATASQPTASDPTAIPIAGLALEIAARAQAGSTRFEIRLDPPELGRVDVRLDVDRHGQVTSRLVVEKPETLDLLRRDAPDLERALQDAGLKTGDNGLQFSLRDQGFNSRNQQAGNDVAQLVLPDPDLPQIEVVAGSYGRDLRLGSGIDIRI